MGSAADFQGIPGVFPGPFLRKRAGGAAAGKLSVEGAGGLCASDMLFSMPLHGRKHNSEGSQEKKEQKGNDDQENMAELNPLPEDYQQNGDEKAAAKVLSLLVYRILDAFPHRGHRYSPSLWMPQACK